jgi:succinate dehydrogenase/fumarate reductase flavoprotein subunit
MKTKIFDTDVLVVGGGLAGIFAAVKAKEQGADVILVSKGRVARSGQTPWATATAVFNPEWGHDLDEWVDHSYIRGEYLINRDWTETILKDSWDRFNDLQNMGVEFLKEKNGEYKREMKKGPSDAILWSVRGIRTGDWAKPLLKHMKKIGVNIVERVTVAELLRKGDQVIGAMGFSADNDDLHTFKAKATVLCAGAGGFKPWEGWPLGDLTADGHVMAYRAGAEITGKEFEDFHPRAAATPKTVRMKMHSPIINAKGEELSVPGMGMALALEAHAGKAPLTKGGVEIVATSALGMSVHTVEGVLPVDMECFSGIPGLYVAGDNAATCVAGAQYAGMGFATATATSTGTRAGIAAGKFVKQTKAPELPDDEFNRAKEFVMAPILRKGGFSPGWATQLLQNYMMPYFITRVKHGDRLQAVLTFVEFLRDHISEKLFARDQHELRLAHEVKNMIINAEMRLRASLFRTESRGMHYREDFPHRNSPEWLAWVILKKEEGLMKACKKPVPEVWWPDLSKSDEELYPYKTEAP